MASHLFFFFNQRAVKMVGLTSDNLAICKNYISM